MENLFGFGLIILLFIAFLFIAFVAGSYILQSLALFTIAKNRMIPKPWLAWLPVGSDWIIGSISDQYQYVVNGKIRNRRKAMLILSIASVVIAQIGSTFVDVEAAFAAYNRLPAVTDALRLVNLIFTILLVAVTVVAAVISYCAMYDLYRSCDPSTCRRNLLLSIFLPVIAPVLLFINRNKELGMPPRKGQTQQAPPEPEIDEDNTIRFDVSEEE